MCDAVEYLTLLKEATANVGKPWGYTQEDVDAVINRTDLNNRANVNWVDELYRSTAPQHGHNVSLNGGSKSLGYYLSYGNLSTSGLFVGNGYHASRNNLRVKVTTTMLDRVKIDANFGYTDVDNWTPASSDSSSDGLFYKALRSSPLTPVRFTDGGWGYGGSSANPIAIIYDGGFINYKARETNLSLGGEMEILKGFTAKIQYATRLKDVLRYSIIYRIQILLWLLRLLLAAFLREIFQNVIRTSLYKVIMNGHLVNIRFIYWQGFHRSGMKTKQ